MSNGWTIGAGATIFDCHWKRMVSWVWTQNETIYCHYNALSLKGLQRAGGTTLSKYDTHYGS